LIDVKVYKEYPEGDDTLIGYGRLIVKEWIELGWKRVSNELVLDLGPKVSILSPILKLDA